MNALRLLERQFTVRNYETDFKQRLKPSAILGYFQETAGDHSEEMGLGFGKLAESGYIWVLSKIYVEIEALPKFRDTVTVSTWPHIPNKAIYERSFEMRSKAGNVLMRAFSRWCILSAKNGRIVPCSRIEQPQIDFIERKSVDFSEWKIDEIQDKARPAFSIKIANSEYDLNNHVNNIKYADYILNCFSVEELRAKEIRSFQIHYVKQSHEGDVLDFYREERGGEYFIEGVKNGEETVVVARVRFE